MGSLTRKKRLRPISFGETVRDVVGDVEALLYTLHNFEGIQFPSVKVMGEKT